MAHKVYTIFFIGLLMLVQSVHAQDTTRTDSVNLQAFQTMRVVKSDTNTRYVLVGGVVLSADSNLFFCDSLIFDSDIDSGIIRAYDNIQVKTVDGVVISSDSLVYSLQSNSGRFLGNCTYKEQNKHIESPYISFNTKSGEGNFAGGGVLRQGATTIQSNYGNYSSQDGASRLTGNVKIKQEDTYIRSKDIIYNAQNETGKILDSTVIYKENLTIYCHEGYLGGATNPSRFGSKTLFVSEKHIGWSDNTEYNPKDSTMIFLSTFHVYDTIDRAGMWGVQALFDNNSGTITGYDRPMVYLIDDADTSYFCADTLCSTNSQNPQDNDADQGTDLVGWGSVRFYSSKEQGQSDSVQWMGGERYSKLDGDVVLWNDSIEVLADHSTMETLDRETDYKKVLFRGNAFWSKTLTDSSLFDQVSGDSLLLFIQNSETRKIEVIQNVHVLVFPKNDKSGEYENGNRSKAEYAVVGLDSLGEVRSLRVEKNVEGEVFSLMEGSNSTVLTSFRTARMHRPHSYIELLSQPIASPISPLILYNQYLTRWEK